MAVITPRFWALLAGVIICAVSAFGVEIPIVDLFKIGVSIAFASFLVPAVR